LGVASSALIHGFPGRRLGRSGEGSPVTAHRYKAFISYSWADRAWGAWLHHALETYRPPKGVSAAKTLHPIFKDREEEAAGSSIGAAIEAALAESEFLIVLASPRAARSSWVNREIAWFKTHRDPHKILALIVDGEPLASRVPGREAEECFPKTLLFKVGPDLQPTEALEDAPLAADAREAGDGPRGAKLKLAAALLGVGLDELVRRDERRRAQRRRAVMSGMAASIAVLAGLAGFAFYQKNAADIARADAELQRDEAQGLVEFMLTDTRQALTALGRLDLLERTGERLLESFARQDIRKLGPDALGRRARVLLLLGEVDNARGDLDAALVRYNEAAAATAELLRRNPDSAQQIFDHAQSVFWVGYIAWMRGDSARAEAQFLDYRRLADALVARDPDAAKWRMERIYALSNLGTLALEQGAAAAAETHFREARADAAALFEQRKDDPDLIITLGQANAWLADSLYLQLKLGEAEAARLAEAALYEQALAAGDNAEIASSLLVARLMLARIELAKGSLDAAAAAARAAAALAERLRRIEPANVEQAKRAANALSALGEIRHLQGADDEARAALGEAARIAESLVARDPTVAEWRSNTAVRPKLALARLEAAAGNADAARALYAAAAAAVRGGRDDALGDPIALRNYCAALAGLARLGDDDQWAEIVRRLEPRQAGAGPEALLLLAEAHARTGGREAAAAILAELAANGFGHPDFLALRREFGAPPPPLTPAAAR
jgi:hypothetical protein